MSDYIFNCFKEHVTTGLVCSLSASATDVLTAERDTRRSVTDSRYYLAHVHIYTANV